MERHLFHKKENVFVATWKIPNLKKLLLHYRSGSSWLFVTPFGLRKVLNWVKMTYNNIPVYITENGVSDRNGSLEDYSRVYFYRNYINEMLKGT